MKISRSPASASTFTDMVAVSLISEVAIASQVHSTCFLSTPITTQVPPSINPLSMVPGPPMSTVSLTF